MSYSLNIKEIFYSIQGEALEAGLPTVFIRLIGCPLRCSYCDTKYAFYGKNIISIADILITIKRYNTKYVCVTGGEPLAQKNVFFLLDELIKKDYQVSIETSGSIDILKVNPKASIVMDVKTPASNEVNKNLLSNIPQLKKTDQLKFVICNKDDFNWCVDFIKNYNIQANILFSPVAGLNSTDLANWVLAKQLPVRIQLQLHKILWGNKKGR